MCDHVLVSSSCCNKLPQSGWLKIIETYRLIVLEASSLKSGVGMAMLSLSALGEVPSLPLSSGDQQSLALLDLQLPCSTVCLHWNTAFFPLSSVSVSVCPFLFLQEHQSQLELGPTLVQYDLILTNFQIRPHSEFQVDMTF